MKGLSHEKSGLCQKCPFYRSRHLRPKLIEGWILFSPLLIKLNSLKQILVFQSFSCFLIYKMAGFCHCGPSFGPLSGLQNSTKDYHQDVSIHYRFLNFILKILVKVSSKSVGLLKSSGFWRFFRHFDSYSAKFHEFYILISHLSHYCREWLIFFLIFIFLGKSRDFSRDSFYLE